MKAACSAWQNVSLYYLKPQMWAYFEITKGHRKTWIQIFPVFPSWHKSSARIFWYFSFFFTFINLIISTIYALSFRRKTLLLSASEGCFFDDELLRQTTIERLYGINLGNRAKPFFAIIDTWQRGTWQVSWNHYHKKSGAGILNGVNWGQHRFLVSHKFDTASIYLLVLTS